MKNSKLQIPNSKNWNLRFLILNSWSKGLTLVEVLVALTILSIGLLGVALMQITSISGNTFSREMAVAIELGQDMLEKLNALQFTDPALAAGPTHPTQNDVNNGLGVGVGAANVTDEMGQTVGPLIYTRTWEVVDNAPATNMKTITVTINWTEKGAVRSITITGVKVQT